MKSSTLTSSNAFQWSLNSPSHSLFSAPLPYSYSVLIAAYPPLLPLLHPPPSPPLAPPALSMDHYSTGQTVRDSMGDGETTSCVWISSSGTVWEVREDEGAWEMKRAKARPSLRNATRKFGTGHWQRWARSRQVELPELSLSIRIGSILTANHEHSCTIALKPLMEASISSFLTRMYPLTYPVALLFI